MFLSRFAHGNITCTHTGTTGNKFSNPSCSCSSFVWSALLVHTQSQDRFRYGGGGGGREVVGRPPPPSTFHNILCAIIILQNLIAKPCTVSGFHLGGGGIRPLLECVCPPWKSCGHTSLTMMPPLSIQNSIFAPPWQFSK